MSRSGTKNAGAQTAGEEAPIVERVSRDRGTRGGKGNRGIPGAPGGPRRKKVLARESRRSQIPGRESVGDAREVRPRERERGALVCVCVWTAKDEEGAEEVEEEEPPPPISLAGTMGRS